MMATFTLGRGLVVRSSTRQWMFYRRLDQQTVQLEDAEDGSIEKFSVSRLTADILNGKLQVVRDADERSGGDESRKDTVAPVASLKDPHRASYERAIGYVRYVRRRGISHGQRERLASAIPIHAAFTGDSDPPSTTTVMRWMQKFRASGGNPGSLITKNAYRRRQQRIPRETRRIIDRMLEKHYFRKHGSTLHEAHDRVLDELERVDLDGQLGSVSLSTIRRIACEVTPYDRDRIRLGPAEARHKWRFIKPGKYVSRPLERVEMDHTLLDIYAIDDELGLPLGRPTITILVCSYSGYIIGFYISFEGENLARLLQTMKIGIQPKADIVAAHGLSEQWHSMGLWECLLVDNAMAFHSQRMRHITYELGVDLEYSAVRMPWFKPTVERYLGEATQMLPVPGRTGKPGRQPDPVDPLVTACIRFSDLCKGILQWVVEVQPFQIHSVKKARPIDLFTEGLVECPAPVFADSYAQLDVLAGLRASVTVRHDGLVHEWIRYAGDSLEQMRREHKGNFRTEIVPNPYDLGQVYVQHPRTREWVIATAKDQDYAAGLTRTQHKLIRKACDQKLTLTNAEKLLRQNRLKLFEHWQSAISAGKQLKRLPKDQELLRRFSALNAAPTPQCQRTALDIEKQFARDETPISMSRSIPIFDTYSGDLA
jgi:putative transposase